MTLRALLVAVLAIAFAVSPLLVSPFQGYDPDAFPVRIERPAIQPVGWAFSIWGLLYLGLIIHGLRGLVRRHDPAWDRGRLLLATSLLVGSFWLWIATRDPWLATFGLWVMMATAIGALLRTPRLEGTDRWLGILPLAMFAGWVTAAMHVSLGAVLAGTGVLTDTGAALVMLASTLAVALSVQLRRPRVPEYGLVVIWALVGIIVANLGRNELVAGAAGLGVGVMAVALLWAGVRARSAVRVW